MVVSSPQHGSGRPSARRRTIGILDLVTKSPRNSLYGRLMNANLASIMPQVLGVWCEEAGHEVRYVCYTGGEDLLDELPADLDVLFIGAFTQAAQLAYALSNLFRARGAVTVLGGPHARCYPEDAQQYFDYVLGFTDRKRRAGGAGGVRAAPADGPRHRGRTASRRSCPRCAARWKFVEATLAKAPTIKIVPMIGSLGCPYTCSFCIDSTVDYQPLGFDAAERRPRVPAHQDEAPDRRLARPQLRRAVRRLHGGDRGRGAARTDAAHRREQPVAARPSRTSSGSSRTASRPSCRASSRGSIWATSRRPGAPGWTRSSRSPTT